MGEVLWCSRITELITEDFNVSMFQRLLSGAVMDLCLRFAVSWLDYELYEKQFGDAELSNV